MQDKVKDVDFFDTYAPVVKWTTVRSLLVLTAQLGLATKQADCTAAFVHADIDKPPNYSQMTPDEQTRVNLLQVGFAQMIDVDPCLFISAKVICVTCVDDCIMAARDAADIDLVIKSLRDLKMTLGEEDELAGFLGIHIEHKRD